MAKKKVAMLGISSVLLVAMVVGVAITATRKTSTSGSDTSNTSEISASAKAVKQICQPTDYKETCEDALSGAGNTTDPKELVKAAFNVTVKHIGEVIKNSSLLQNAAKDRRIQDALENCRELLDFSIDDIKKSFAKVRVIANLSL